MTEHQKLYIHIRNAEAGEGEELARIEALCFPPAEAAKKEEVLERLQVFPENFFVAEYEGKIVGFINGGTADEAVLPDEFYHDLTLHRPDGAYQTVFGLNVIPEFRKKGIARMLVMHLTEMTRQRGKKGVVLTCKEHLIPFYSSCGFDCHGVADSEHGGAVWYDMRLEFGRE